MDLSAPEMDTELVDLSGVTLAALGSLDPVAVDHAAQHLLDTDRRPVLGSSSSAGTCPDGDDLSEPEPVAAHAGRAARAGEPEPPSAARPAR